MCVKAAATEHSVVEDVLCDEASVLFADCNSCTCCQSCCSEESTDPNDPYCHYDFNFYDVVGTVSHPASVSAMRCQSFIDISIPGTFLFQEYQCFSRGLPGRVCPDGGSLSTAARPP